MPAPIRRSPSLLAGLLHLASHNIQSLLADCLLPACCQPQAPAQSFPSPVSP